MTALNIPPEYQKLSQNRAAQLAGLPRTTFKRKYWDTGKLSLSNDNEGNEYVTFEEVYRIFGEAVTQNLKAFIDGQHEHMPKQDQNIVHGTNGQGNIPPLVSMDKHIFTVQLENERLKAEKDGLDKMVIELRDQLERERTRLSLAEQRALTAENQVKGLLEDHRKKEADTQRITTLEKQQEELLNKIQDEKGFWKKLFAAFQ